MSKERELLQEIVAAWKGFPVPRAGCRLAYYIAKAEEFLSKQSEFDAEGWREMGPEELPDRDQGDQYQDADGVWNKTNQLGTMTVRQSRGIDTIKYRTRRPLPTK